MVNWLLKVLHIRSREKALVGRLFLVQFFLGIGHAFLFTSTLTLFLSAFGIQALPKVYIVSAILLILFNVLYGWLDANMSAKRLLQYVILFAIVCSAILWALFLIGGNSNLPFIASCAYLILYMLVGYGFWGVAAVLFNVRESKRLFSLIGAGDLPAKMLGYASLSLLVPYTGVENLLCVPVVSYTVAYILLFRFVDPQGIITHHESVPYVPSKENRLKGILTFLLPDRLVAYIALLSIVGYALFGLIDFTFLSEVKLKYDSAAELASFLAIFFAVGRSLALLIKVFLTSRIISRIGLIPSLLLNPLILLAGCIVVISTDAMGMLPLYIFGAMVLFSEVLRSTVYEPVFFILFQPLSPHNRLKGHLIAKGFTLPLALLPLGIFLLYYLERKGGVDIVFLASTLLVLCMVWIGVMLLLKRVYQNTLLRSIRRGYFRGGAIFIDQKTRKLLLEKTFSHNAGEVLYALRLLERSTLEEMDDILTRLIRHPDANVVSFAIGKIVERRSRQSLPQLKTLLEEGDPGIDTPGIVFAIFSLEQASNAELISMFGKLRTEYQPAALSGMLSRNDEATSQFVNEHLELLASSSEPFERLKALDILERAKLPASSTIIGNLLRDRSPVVVRRAIHVAGICCCKEVLQELPGLAGNRSFHAPLIQALSQMGESLFASPFISSLNDQQKELVLEAAARQRTTSALNFMFGEINGSHSMMNMVIALVWRQKFTLSDEQKNVLRACLERLHASAKQKSILFQKLTPFAEMNLVQKALLAECRSDAVNLLRGYSLIFESEALERTLNFLEAGNLEKIHNAIEAVELALPDVEFKKLNTLLELVLEPHVDARTPYNDDSTSTQVCRRILEDKEALYNRWTRSVACYLLPPGEYIDEYDVRAASTSNTDIFNETRTHKLSVVN